MAKFAFLTFYDKICLGPRILSSVVKEAGHKSDLIIFKGDSGGDIVQDSNNNDSVNFQYFQYGYLRGTNYDVNPWTSREVGLLINLLKGLAPDVVCLSTRSFWTKLGKEIVDSIRLVLPNTPIVAGGWGPSLEPEKYLEYCDYSCFGEGEETILEMGTALDQGLDFKGIKNLVYKENGETISNKAAKPIESLDWIPFPDFELSGKYLIDENTLQTGSEFYNEKVYDVFVGRGCPLSCSYCMSGQWNSLYKEKHEHHFPKTRLRSPENCIAEIEKAKERGALFIRIKDEVFPAKKGWVLRFLDLYKEKINLPFFAYLRPEFHKPEMVDQLVRAGLRTTGLGIQSGSDTIRKEIYNRRCPNEKVKLFAQVLSAKNVEFHYDIISYNPFEKERDLRETFRFLCTLPFSELKVFKLNFFPDAPISKMIETAKPVGEVESVYYRYSILYSLATHNKATRIVSRFIENYGLFKGSTKILQLLFLPALINERIKKAQAKKKYNAASLILPGMQHGKNESVFESKTKTSESLHEHQSAHPLVSRKKTQNDNHQIL